jgi:hypothetical protein
MSMDLRMMYYKKVTNDGDSHFFREDEIHEAIANVNECFFPITVSVVTQREYMDDIYGEGEWGEDELSGE